MSAKSVYAGKQPSYRIDNGIDFRDVGSVITESERHLYVPSKSISWDAQCERAYRLISQGEKVYVHRHGWGQKCKTNVAPNEGCLVSDLTDTDDGAKLVPVSDRETQTVAHDVPDSALSNE